MFGARKLVLYQGQKYDAGRLHAWNQYGRFGYNKDIPYNVYGQ